MPVGPRLGVVAVLLAALGGGWYLRDRQADPARETAGDGAVGVAAG
jgi:hypothetical protein